MAQFPPRPPGRRPGERWLRRVAVTAASRTAPEPADASEPSDRPEHNAATDRRMEHQPLWVDLQIRRAMERGDFDNLPGAGKPIRGLGRTHDPDWWVKGLIEREQITGVLPAALALRNEDAELDERLDREVTEGGVRRVVADFNERVVEARRQLRGGPPVVTPTRDAGAEVARWLDRRAERRETARQQRRHRTSPQPARRRTTRRTRLWPRRGGSPDTG